MAHPNCAVLTRLDELQPACAARTDERKPGGRQMPAGPAVPSAASPAVRESVGEADSRKVLVIPDVHLKPWMFELAHSLAGECDLAVVLGDLVDGRGRQLDVGLYGETIGVAAAFAEAAPDSLWRYGNHGYCYLHHEEWIGTSGFSEVLKSMVAEGLRALEAAVGGRYKVVHEVDGVLF